MGRIIFLSAIAYVAYRYIARSNQKHQEIEGTPDAALLPAGHSAPQLTSASEAIEVAATPARTPTSRSAAAEPDPVR